MPFASPHPRAKCYRRALSALAVACLGGIASAASAAETAPRVASASYLKRLSLEELLALDVTTVSRRPQAFSASASAISVLTGDDVRRSGATTLADALRWNTGLEVARIDGRTWGVAARGFNLSSSNKLLVMMDGRSLYTPLFSGVLWDAQDTELADLERIEVVRGPGATMWGANAVNGVINIQTKSARDTQGTLLSTGGGTEEKFFASARQGFAFTPEVHARVYVKTFHRDDLALPGGADAGDDWEMVQGGFRVDGGTEAASRGWTLQGDIYQGFLGAGATADSRIAGGNLLGRVEHRFDADRRLRTQFYYDRVERSVAGQFSERRDTLDFDVQYSTPAGERHHLLAGLTARTSADRTGVDGTVRFNPADRRMSVISGLLQDEVGFLDDRLGVTAGIKLEQNSSTGFEFQPSIRASWQLTPKQTVWAALSRAIRTPSRFDDDLRLVFNGTTFFRGTPDFESEELMAYEAGWRVSPSSKLNLDLSLFANHYGKLRSQEVDTSGTALYVLRNKLNAKTCGGELAATWQVLVPWRLRATYSYLDKTASLDAGSTDPTGGNQEGNDPKHMLTFVSTVELGRHWEFDTLVRYVSELPNPVVPAYTTLDLHVGWNPVPAWELSLVGQNLLDAQHREFGAASAAAREVQRSVHGRVTWRF